MHAQCELCRTLKTVNSAPQRKSSQGQLFRKMKYLVLTKKKEMAFNFITQHAPELH